MHISVPLDQSCEFIDITPINPLISKCQIKVCYVSDSPNRNGTVITKDTAKEMANSLPGCPIVGYYIESNKDFDEHSRNIEIVDNKIVFTDITVPYGFVDINAKVWFQKFVDDSKDVREYLMTEGYIWTGQFPESKRILERGNNQSMELDDKTIKGSWSKDEKGIPQFFIINEAIFSKLCILGENVEPCFEGSQIKAKFSLDEDFTKKLYSMANELKEILNEGGTKQQMFKFSMNIGDSVWESLYSLLEQNYPASDKSFGSDYQIIGFAYDQESKSVVVKDKKSDKNYSINFSIGENDTVEFNGDLTEIGSSEYTKFSVQDVENYEKSRYENFVKKDGQKDNTDPNEKTKNNDGSEESEKKNDKEKKYSLSDLEDYAAIQNSTLQKEYTALQNKYSLLEDEIIPLREFKKTSELKAKQEMINSFYMLSDDDKKDVIENINAYSLNDIEAKLSIICVRNKVNFNLDKEESAPSSSLTYSLDPNLQDDAPAWIKAARKTAKNK